MTLAVSRRRRIPRKMIAILVAVGLVSATLLVLALPASSPLSPSHSNVLRIIPESKTVILQNGTNFVAFNVSLPQRQTGSLSATVKPNNITLLGPDYRVHQVNVTVTPWSGTLEAGSTSRTIIIIVGPSRYFGSGYFQVTPKWTS